MTDITGQEMLDSGFNYGDKCKVALGNGYVIDDVPFYSGYFGKTGENVIVDYQGNDGVKIACCQGESLWAKSGCIPDDTVEIVLVEKGTYLDVQSAMEMTYSVNRNDYQSDEIFSNFRVLNGGKLKENMFYRGASAINDEFGRAAYTDELLKKYNISYVLDFNTNEDKLKTYFEKYDVSGNYYLDLYNRSDVLLTKIDNNFFSLSASETIANAFKEMMKHDGPYYINCTEGKDRTGFVCVLIEILGDYTLDDLRDDYMTTYRCYYGIDENDTSKYNAIVEYKFNDMMFNLTETESLDVLKKTDLKQAAKNYLLNGQMSEDEIEELEDFITE